MALALSASAERILYIDAAMPGNDPANQWNDLSASAYHFANNPTNPATYNAGDLSYDFDFSSRMVGTGDESIFDFETDCTAADELECIGSDGTPFSIVAYVNQNWVGGDAGTFNIVSKTDEPGDGQYRGWVFRGNPDSSVRFHFVMQPGNNTDRHFARTDFGVSGAPVLLVATTDGSGVLSNANWYVNGADVLVDPNPNFDLLFGSILNDNQLVLGRDGSVSNTNGWQGSLFFLEIHDVELTPGEVAARWNGGAVERAGVGSPIVSSTLKTVTGIPGYTFESLPGQSYAVEVTSDPVSGPWTTISTIIGNGGPTTAFDTGPGAANRILRYNLSIGQ